MSSSGRSLQGNALALRFGSTLRKHCTHFNHYARRTRQMCSMYCCIQSHPHQHVSVMHKMHLHTHMHDINNDGKMHAENVHTHALCVRCPLSEFCHAQHRQDDYTFESGALHVPMSKLHSRNLYETILPCTQDAAASRASSEQPPTCTYSRVEQTCTDKVKGSDWNPCLVVVLHCELRCCVTLYKMP